MTTPTTRPTSMTGAETTTNVMMASRPTSRTSGPVIFLVAPALASDRHLHDVLIGGDDLVAHRDHRVDRDLRLRHRGDDVDHVGFAGGDRAGLHLGLLPRLRHRPHGLLEHGRKAGAALLPAGQRR